VTHLYARNILTVMAFALWIKSSNVVLIVGVLRAGGDARVSALIDAVPVWLIGIPLATIGAFVFGLPVYWVYLADDRRRGGQVRTRGLADDLKKVDHQSCTPASADE